MGRRSIEEIKRKLYELETLTEDSSMNVCNYTDMLNELIGLNEVKEQVRKIAAFFTRQDCLAVMSLLKLGGRNWCRGIQDRLLEW